MTTVSNERQIAAATAKALHALAQRVLQDGASIMNLAIRSASDTDPIKADGVAFQYAESRATAADQVAKIVSAFEAGQPPEWQKKRRYQRDAAKRQAIRQAFVNGEQPIATAEWTTAVVIEAARQRRDIVGCAIACIEQGRDGGEIVQALANYLAGYWTIWTLESALKKAGYAPAGNVVPLVPLRRTGG